MPTLIPACRRPLKDSVHTLKRQLEAFIPRQYRNPSCKACFLITESYEILFALLKLISAQPSAIPVDDVHLPIRSVSNHRPTDRFQGTKWVADKVLKPGTGLLVRRPPRLGVPCESLGPYHPAVFQNHHAGSMAHGPYVAVKLIVLRDWEKLNGDKSATDQGPLELTIGEDVVLIAKALNGVP
jgi:hypothetical protein